MNEGALITKQSQEPSWTRAWRKVKHGLVLKYLLDRLLDLSIEVLPYYLVEEGMFGQAPPCRDDDFKDFKFEMLDYADMEEIGAIAGREFNADQLRKRLDQGMLCFGARHQDKIAAFTWCNLKECTFKPLSLQLQPGDVYLADAYTGKAYRGLNLLPGLRYHCYQELQKLGCRRFFSISEAFNKPSNHFKRKLGARFGAMYLYISLFHQVQKNWKIFQDKHGNTLDKAEARIEKRAEERY